MTTDDPFYPPRDGDLPRDELAELAEKALAYHGGPDKCKVHFKYTCKWCGERCTLSDPNTLWEKGECHKCGKETEIQYGGFSIMFKP